MSATRTHVDVDSESTLQAFIAHMASIKSIDQNAPEVERVAAAPSNSVAISSTSGSFETAMNMKTVEVANNFDNDSVYHFKFKSPDGLEQIIPRGGFVIDKFIATILKELSLRCKYAFTLQACLQLYEALLAKHNVPIPLTAQALQLSGINPTEAFESGFQRFCLQEEGQTLEDLAAFHTFVPRTKYDVDDMIQAQTSVEEGLESLTLKNYAELGLESNLMKPQTVNYAFPEGNGDTKRHNIENSDCAVKTDHELVFHDSGHVDYPLLYANVKNRHRIEDSYHAIGVDREIVFKNWPTPTKRDGPAHRVRRATLQGIPHGVSAGYVASLIHGGLVESIHFQNGQNFADVVFVDADQCMAFCKANAAGIKMGSVVHAGLIPSTITVKLSTTIDILSSKMKENILTGATRCVRVMGIPEADIPTHGTMLSMAQNNGRKVQDVKIMTLKFGYKQISFVFLNIADSIKFKTTLGNDANFEEYNIQYGKDPCDTK